MEVIRYAAVAFSVFGAGAIFHYKLTLWHYKERITKGQAAAQSIIWALACATGCTVGIALANLGW